MKTQRINFVLALTTSASLLAFCAGSVAAPRADYQLQGVLTSTVGTPPALANLGPGRDTFAADTVDGVSRQVLQFPLHNGVALSPTTGVVPPGTYTIGLLAALDAVTGNRRLVDFKHGVSDNGLYESGGKLAFVNLSAGSAPVPIPPGTYHQYVVTRDGLSKKLTGYVDGLQAFSVTDSAGLGLIDASSTLRFFRDNDTGGTTGEDTSGKVARVRLYNAALDAESVAQLDWLANSPRHTATRDFAFFPVSTLPTLGGRVEWDFYGSASHTATDTTGMGLFDSGAKGRGGLFRKQFTAAGTYSFHCSIHPSMVGSVKVPMQVMPRSGGVATAFNVRWAKVTAPAGFVYDVQIRRPSDSAFVDFLVAQTQPNISFTPDAGAGSYQFQARLRKLSGGQSGFSVPLAIPVS